MVARARFRKVTLLALGLLAACQAKSKVDSQDSGDSGTSGPGAGNHLPTCAAHEPVLSQPTCALSDLRSLGPLVHLAPSPHPFPTDHMYFSFVAGAVVL